jgi:hypothetical protein
MDGACAPARDEPTTNTSTGRKRIGTATMEGTS